MFTLSIKDAYAHKEIGKSVTLHQKTNLTSSKTLASL
jgi:hypothetical protein